MGRTLVALFSGLAFGIGLIVSQMADPNKVLGFLDLLGSWDPSLAVVMASALLVTTAGYRYAFSRSQPILDTERHTPSATQIDRRLVGGAALFGLGWGLVGFCPGPAIVSLATGNPKVIGFVAAMLAGMALYEASANRQTGGRDR